MLMPVLMNLRLRLNSPSTPPPGMYREPIITSWSRHAGQDRRDEPGRVAEVGVHVQEVVVAVRRWRSRIAARTAVPSPSLPGRWMTWSPGQFRLDLVGDPAGAVGRVVVDDQDRGLGRVLADRLDERAKVAGLVVGGQRDEESPRGRRENLVRCASAWCHLTRRFIGLIEAGGGVAWVRARPAGLRDPAPGRDPRSDREARWMTAPDVGLKPDGLPFLGPSVHPSGPAGRTTPRRHPSQMRSSFSASTSQS